MRERAREVSPSLAPGLRGLATKACVQHCTHVPLQQGRHQGVRATKPSVQQVRQGGPVRDGERRSALVACRGSFRGSFRGSARRCFRIRSFAVSPESNAETADLAGIGDATLIDDSMLTLLLLQLLLLQLLRKLLQKLQMLLPLPRKRSCECC